MNDINSDVTYTLSFYFKIPEELCQNKMSDLVDMYCTPGVEYDRANSYKWIAILNNQKRFVSDIYDGKGHIVKETTL